MTATLGSGAARFVGQRVARREDPRLVTGRGRYVDDVILPRMAHAAFVRSEAARGTITRLDATAARALDGVVAVFTAEDFEGDIHAWWVDMMGPPGETNPMPPLRALASGDVRFVGDPIAIVIAESRYVAEDAAELIELDIEALPAVITRADALAEGAPIVHSETDSNVASVMPEMPDPSLEKIFAEAAHVITETFNQHRYIPAPMECRGVVASWDAAMGKLDVTMSTQGPHSVRAFLARCLDVAENNIHVVMGDVGGAFGQKMFMMQEELATVLAAKHLGRPVKWIEDRRENLIAGHHSRDESLTLTFAVDADGRILALKGHAVENVGAFPYPSSGSTAGIAMLVITGPYKIPRSAMSAMTVYTNTCGRCAYRGPWMMETVAREQMMDVCAHTLGIDPLEFRRRNVIRQADLPYTSAMGLPYDAMTPAEALDLAAEIIGYEEFRKRQAAARLEGRYLGIGLSSYIEPSGMAMGAMASEAATVRVSSNGAVEVAVGSASHGHSLETTVVQVVADALGVDMDIVTLVQGDTTSTPYGGGTGGSRSAVLYSGAAREAALEVRDKALRIAAHALEASPDDLELVDGAARVKGTPAAAIPFQQIAMMAYLGSDGFPPDLSPGLEGAARFKPSAMFTFTNSTHAVTVEVDPATGAVEIDRYVVSEDCGVMINPTVVEGQIAGGVAQGIGGVLYEHFIYDEDGNPLTTTFLDYLLPTAAEVPDYEYGHLETPATTNPGGHKGLGEGGAIGAPPAIINAIADALSPLGVTVKDQPLGPKQILALFEQAGR